MPLSIGIVADISNLYFCAQKAYGKKVNYREIIEFAKTWGDITYAAAYGASIGGQAAKFEASLETMGFETHFKVPKTLKRAKTLKHKADWDVGMAVDTLKEIDRFDLLILCTADGDLAPLVVRLMDLGKRVWIMGVNISHELEDVAEQTFEIVSTFLEKR